MSRYILKPPVGAVLNKHHPLAKGLVGAWLMNEARGLITNEYIHHDKCILEGASFSNSSVYFNGNDAGIHCGARDHVGNSSPISIVGKIHPTSLLANGSNIISKYDSWSVGGNQYRFRLRSDDDGFGFTRDNTVVWNTMVTANLNEDISFGFCGSSSGGRMYKNGVLETQTDESCTTASSGDENQVWIGVIDYTDEEFTGYMYYLYLYTRCLSPAEILSLHLDPYQMFRHDPIELWTYEAAGTNNNYIRFHSNGNVSCTGIIDETHDHFRLINNGSIECSEFDEITLG